MTSRLGICKASSIEAEEIAGAVLADGGATFVLNSPDIIDRESFFEAARRYLPMDPPFPPGSHSWDALSDSVWQGLYDRSESEFAIIWPNAHKMALRAPFEFRIAVDALEGVYELLLDPSATLGRVKHVAIVLEGQWALVPNN